jgi:nucleotide-binding universal stress UspA family protein
MNEQLFFKNVLLPLDGSEEAEQRLEEAMSLVKVTNGELILLHVIEPFASWGQDIGNEFSNSKHQRNEYLNKIKARVEAEGVSVKAVLIPGRPAEEICKYAVRDEVDIVLVSPHGASGILGWAIGSVADKVARHSPKPVLVMRRSSK